MTPTSAFGFGPDGFSFGAPGAVFQLRLRGVIQADARDFPDSRPAVPNEFLIRRARIYIEGAVSDIADFRLLPEFGQGQFQLLDAFIDFHPVPVSWLKLRIGKYKTPFGLERLVAEQNLRFIERGISSNLVPDRDIGASFHGDAWRGLLQYEAGVLNGTVDNGNVDLDLDGEKDVVGRLVLQPLRPLKNPLWDDIGIGAAVTEGRVVGTSANTLLATYRTGGQNGFFSYLSSSSTPANTVLAHGTHVRFSPQAYAFIGPVGAPFEYVDDVQNLSKAGVTAHVVSSAWQVQAYWVITGEHGNLDGVTPAKPLNWKKRQAGAVELIARYGALSVGRTAFPNVADPTKSARGAKAWAVGANWYLARPVKLAVNYERTLFEGGVTGGNRGAENALFGRVQLAF